MACLNPFCLFLLPFEWGFDCPLCFLPFDFLMTHLTESCLTEKSELWLPGWMNFPSISRSDIPLTDVNPESTYKLENRVILPDIHCAFSDVDQPWRGIYKLQHLPKYKHRSSPRSRGRGLLRWKNGMSSQENSPMHFCIESCWIDDWFWGVFFSYFQPQVTRSLFTQCQGVKDKLQKHFPPVNKYK